MSQTVEKKLALTEHVNEHATKVVEQLHTIFSRLSSMPVIIKPNMRFYEDQPSRWEFAVHSILRLLGSGSLRMSTMSNTRIPRTHLLVEMCSAFSVLSHHMSGSDVWIFFAESGLLVFTTMNYVIQHNVFSTMLESSSARMTYQDGTLGPLVISTTLPPESVFLYTQHEVTRRLAETIAHDVKAIVAKQQGSSVLTVHSRCRTLMTHVSPEAIPTFTADQAMVLLFESTFGDLSLLAWNT